MEESVREQLIQVTDVQAREQLVRLHDVLKSASGVRAHLQVDVTGAGDKFMSAQAGAFRSRRPSSFPDLETRLLPDALNTAQSHLARSVDELLLTLFPAVIPKTPDLSNVLALLLARREYDEAGDDESEGGEMLPFKTYVDPFSEAVTQAAQGWLARKFAIGGSWKLDELLVLAEDEGLSMLERQCIVYALYRSYPDSENLFRGMRARADGQFSADVAAGDNLRFDPVETR